MGISLLILIIILSVLSSVVVRHPKHDRFLGYDYDHMELEDYNYEGRLLTHFQREFDASKVHGGYPEDALVRLKSFENKSEHLDSNDMESIKEALREILSGRNIEELFTLQSEDRTHTHASRRGFLKPADTDKNSKRGRRKTIRKRDDNIDNRIVKFGDGDDDGVIKIPKPTTTTTTSSTDQQDTNSTTIPLCYTTTTTNTKTTKTKTRPYVMLDIPALMDIISNFTYDWLENLTRSVNETLMQKGIPTCPQLTTSPSTYAENMTGTLMGKCFYCGLEETGVPRHAHCADAFAGDFLPLVPVNPKARSQLAKYRKYCRYKNNLSPIPHYRDLVSDTKTLWGEWTGGCAVRWIDLSGIYTQRVCRIRHKPLLGKHYGSKRMAKLELALQNVDNGCIISPMASLVPFARGISLYARFHACVCTGNWCNRAIVNQPWTMYIVILLVYAIAKDFVVIF